MRGLTHRGGPSPTVVEKGEGTVWSLALAISEDPLRLWDSERMRSVWSTSITGVPAGRVHTVSSECGKDRRPYLGPTEAPAGYSQPCL